MSKEAYYEWNKWENMDYQETYCHKTGEQSNGNTNIVI